MEFNEITVHLISCTCEKCKCECWYQESLSTSVNCVLTPVLVISFVLLQGKRSQWTWISTYVHIFEISIGFYTLQYKFENLIWQSNKAPVLAKSNSWTLVKLTGSTPSLSLFSLSFQIRMELAMSKVQRSVLLFIVLAVIFLSLYNYNGRIQQPQGDLYNNNNNKRHAWEVMRTLRQLQASQV